MDYTTLFTSVTMQGRSKVSHSFSIIVVSVWALLKDRFTSVLCLQKGFHTCRSLVTIHYLHITFTSDSLDLERSESRTASGQESRSLSLAVGCRSNERKQTCMHIHFSSFSLFELPPIQCQGGPSGPGLQWHNSDRSASSLLTLTSLGRVIKSTGWRLITPKAAGRKDAFGPGQYLSAVPYRPLSP